MPHVAPWYRREDYARIREIMDDGDGLPATFDDWERAAKDQLTAVVARGIEIKPVILEPEEFLAYCEREKLPRRGSRERSMFAIARERARGLTQPARHTESNGDLSVKSGHFGRVQQAVLRAIRNAGTRT
jgi:hypothetical protein